MSTTTTLATSRIITLWGNIGAGKSSLLQSVASAGWTVIPEPVEQWGPFLRLMYTNPREWIYLFQMKVLAHYLDVTRRVEACTKGKTYVVERSPLEVLLVFLPANREHFVNEEEYESARVLAHTLATRPCWRQALSVNIWASPETCATRIGKRQREGEALIDIDYLRKLDGLYRAVLNHDMTLNNDDDKKRKEVTRLLVGFISAPPPVK